LKDYFSTSADNGGAEMDDIESTRRMVKKAVQCGRSEQRGDAYSGPYVEPLRDARTKLAAFFNILLGFGRSRPYRLAAARRKVSFVFPQALQDAPASHPHAGAEPLDIRLAGLT
jgi:hypothetical protein